MFRTFSFHIERLIFVIAADGVTAAFDGNVAGYRGQRRRQRDIGAESDDVRAAACRAIAGGAVAVGGGYGVRQAAGTAHGDVGAQDPSRRQARDNQRQGDGAKGGKP